MSRWNARFRFYCQYCLANNWVGHSTYINSEWEGLLRDQPKRELNRTETNRLEAFIKNPTAYASGSEKSKEKIQYLKDKIRPMLSHIDLVRYYQAKREYDSARQNINLFKDPKCPRCGSKMVRRSGKFGEFWGCLKYPLCKGTLNIHWAHK